MNNHKPAVRLVSPASFPLDPRYEQTRTPISSVRPAGRVFEGHKRDASRLLNLPDEILWLITGFVAEENQGRFLSQFALTHRECRQLARPYQFADVWVTRSERSCALVRHLKTENPENGMPPIGDFIRCLTLTIDRDFDSEFGLAPEDNELEEAWTERWEGFINEIAQVVQTCMPNLDQVYWMNMAELSPLDNLLPAVLQRAASPGRLRNLYFEDYGFCFNDLEDAVSVFSSFPADATFSLRDLAFGFNRWKPSYSDPDGGTALFVETVLRRSASTLESYVGASQFQGPYEFESESLITFRDGPINFRNLRKFWSYHEDSIRIDSVVLESFLSAPLESFAPSGQICSAMLAHDPARTFPMPNLRTFAMVGAAREVHPSEQSEYIDKVLGVGRSYGPQLKELFIYLLGVPDIPNLGPSQIASHISSGDFRNLRSLSFAWVQDPDLSVLQAIGSSLLSLEELSFGFQPETERSGIIERVSWDFTWVGDKPPNHTDIISAISPLSKLVRLGVFGDEYIADWAGSHWSWHRFYKDYVWFHQGRSFTERKHGAKPDQGQTWSEAARGHNRPGNCVEDWLTPWVTGTSNGEEARQAVAEIAAKYAKAFPKLEEFMSGRVLIEVAGRSQDH